MKITKFEEIEAWKKGRELTKSIYRVSSKDSFSKDWTLRDQIRRAAISVRLNTAEGCSRKSQNERNRYFEIARGSVIEIDSAIGIAFKLEYVILEELQPLGDSIMKTFKLLSGMIKSDNTHN